jgi:hypothetical protein
LRVSGIGGFAMAAGLVVGLVAGGVGAQTPPAPEVQAWDQAKVGALAAALAATVKDLRQDVRQQPQPSLGSMQSRAYHSFRDDLRLIESEAQELASALASGAGHDETLPIVQRMETLIREARDESRRLLIPQSTQDKIASARTAFQQVRPYYDL